jgi:hypothetical protein
MRDKSASKEGAKPVVRAEDGMQGSEYIYTNL